MSMLALNGVPVIAGYIMIPDEGPWTANLTISTESIGKAAVLESEGGLRMQGSIVSSGDFSGRTKTKIVGGAGNLSMPLPAKHYSQVSAVEPIGDIVRGANEQWSGSAPGTLSHWTRLEGPAGAQLSALAKELDVVWYVDIVGVIHFASLDYPEAVRVPSYEVLSDDKASRVMTLGVDHFWLLPRVTLADRKVRAVVHELDGSGGRTKVFYS
jgi:hypothetical protein